MDAAERGSEGGAGLAPWGGVSPENAAGESPEGFRTLRESGVGPNWRRLEPRLPRGERAVPAEMPAPQRPLGFNCPSCGVVLVIREPHNYDGQPAPCPHCEVQILPPRIVYTARTFDLHSTPGLSLAGLASARTPRPLHRMERRGKVSWRDTQGEVLPAES